MTLSNKKHNFLNLHVYLPANCNKKYIIYVLLDVIKNTKSPLWKGMNTFQWLDKQLNRFWFK